MNKICDICLNNPCLLRCPNYLPPKTSYTCGICGEGIGGGEDYIENWNGDYIHYECIKSIRHLLELLGSEVKTMEGDSDVYAG